MINTINSDLSHQVSADCLSLIHSLRLDKIFIAGLAAEVLMQVATLLGAEISPEHRVLGIGSSALSIASLSIGSMISIIIRTAEQIKQ